MYNFDIPGEKRTTESTTNIFQKISIIDSQVNEKVYFQGLYNTGWFKKQFFALLAGTLVVRVFKPIT